MSNLTSRVSALFAAVIGTALLAGPATAQDKFGGMHVGAHIGWGWGDLDATRLDASNNFPLGFQVGRELDGFIGGFHAGYDVRFGNMLVGVGGEYSWSDMSGSSSAASPLIAGRVSHANSELDWIGTLTGRVGFVAGDWLFYGRAGWAWSALETAGPLVNAAGTVLVNNEASTKLDGWTVGAGIEWALSKNWSVRAQYDYHDLNATVTTRSVNVRDGAVTFSRADTDVDVHTVKLGVSMRFGK